METDEAKAIYKERATTPAALILAPMCLGTVNSPMDAL
jgi:hypothetical protein